MNDTDPKPGQEPILQALTLQKPPAVIHSQVYRLLPSFAEEWVRRPTLLYLLNSRKGLPPIPKACPPHRVCNACFSPFSYQSSGQC